MQPRYALMSIVAGGILMGAAVSQAVPSEMRAVQEPAWRTLIQPQYQLAYSPVGQGGGPEDSTGVSLAMVSYDPDALTEAEAYAFPPEYAEAERFAREEARAAADAERRFRLAYAEATRPESEVSVTSGNRTEQVAAVTDEDQAQDAASAAEDQGGAKIIAIAAQTNET